MPRPAERLGAVLGLVCLLLLGCTGQPEDPPAPPVASGAPVGAAATTTRAAELRAALTYLLTERVSLTLAHARVLTAAAARVDAEPVVEARQAFTASGAELVAVLGGSYSDADEQLSPAVRAHDRALLEHTVALTAGDDDAARRSLDDLEGAGGELARAVRRVVPGLREQDVEAALASGTATTLEAVGAVVAQSPRAPGLHRTAHEAAWSTARLLAVGVSTDRGLGLAGSPATELRGRLTGLLAEHVLLTTELAARLGEVGGAESDPLVQATDAALDAAAVSLADLMGRTAPETALPVLTAWRGHLAEVRALAVARAVGAPAPPAPREFLDLLREALTPHADPLPPRAGELGSTASASFQAAVDAAARGDGTARALLRTAAQDTVAPAALLSAALAEQLDLS